MMHNKSLTNAKLATMLVAASAISIGGCETMEILNERIGNDSVDTADASIWPVPTAEVKQKSAEAIGDGLTLPFVEIDNYEEADPQSYRLYSMISFEVGDLRTGRVYYMLGRYQYRAGGDGPYLVKLVKEKAEHVFTPEQAARRERLRPSE